MKKEEVIEEKNLYVVRFGGIFFSGVIMGVLGIIFLIYGIVAVYKYDNAISFEQLNIENCKEGQYVKGEIKDLIYDELRGGEIQGVSEEMVAGASSIYTYTTYCGDGEWIRIHVNTPDKHREFKNFLLREEPLVFEGKLVKTTDELNLGWYENRGFENTDDIIEEYIVVQTNINRGKQFIWGGIGFIAFCAIFIVLYWKFCRNGLLYR